MSDSREDLATRISSSLSRAVNGLALFVCPSAMSVLASSPMDLIESIIRDLEPALEAPGLRVSVGATLAVLRVPRLRTAPWTVEKTKSVAVAAMVLCTAIGLFRNLEGPCPLHGRACSSTQASRL